MNAGATREPEPLEVRIHRGTHEIGGNCVELRHSQDTLILDIGKPLAAAWDEIVPLPAAIGLGDHGTRPFRPVKQGLADLRGGPWRAALSDLQP